MNVGIVCYPSIGGSGIVATELGKCLAARGHRVDFISYELPFRLRGFHENIYFHPVETPTYPVLKEPPYILSLANKIVEVHRQVGLDIIHAHYAVPHATAAYLAREMVGPGAPRVVTTLHGTDITLLGQEPSFSESIAFAINCSDGVTAVSKSLRQQTLDTLPIHVEIRPIPNFLDCSVYRAVECDNLRRRFAGPGEAVVLHMSNFRAVKRVDLVVRAFATLAAEKPARLLLVGDGPEARGAAELARQLGVAGRIHFAGEQEEVMPLLSLADVFLLPSEREAFGLAALEAMACGVPVVASDVGGLPEVVLHGETGLLVPVGDLDALVTATGQLLDDPARARRMGAAARDRVHQCYCSDIIVPKYEAFYEEVLARRRAG